MPLNRFKNSSDFFTDHSEAVLLLWILFVISVELNITLVFIILLCLFFAASWSPAEKGLTSRLLCVLFPCVIATFPSGVVIECIDSFFFTFVAYK